LTYAREHCSSLHIFILASWRLAGTELESLKKWGKNKKGLKKQHKETKTKYSHYLEINVKSNFKLSTVYQELKLKIQQQQQQQKPISYVLLIKENMLSFIFYSTHFNFQTCYFYLLKKSVFPHPLT